MFLVSVVKTSFLNLIYHWAGMVIHLLQLKFSMTTAIVSNASSIRGQSYKHFTIVNYDSRVVIWGIFKSGMTLESYITIVEAL